MLITASIRQLMEEAELLQLAVRVKQVQHMSRDTTTCHHHHNDKRDFKQEVYHNPDNFKRSLLNRVRPSVGGSLNQFTLKQRRVAGDCR